MLAEKINKWYLAVQEVLLCLMIIALPFMKLPSRYGLFGMGTNLPVVLGSVSVILFLVYSVYKREMHIPFKKFFLIAILWMFICEVWGVLTFPYYDEAIYEYLRDTRVVKLFYQWIPSLEDMNIFLHFKLLGSQLWYLVREMVFPLMGIVCIILTLYRRHALHFVNLMTKMAYILIIMMSAYSVIEVLWIWSQASIFRDILVAINYHLFDAETQSGWWPPLLWKGQVRSLALEPSYFSIIASFLVPLLWIRIWGEGRKKELFLLAFFTFLIFMTKARTGILIYIGEVVFFVLLSLMVRYTNWWKTVLQVLLVTLFAFGVMVGGSAIVPSMVGYGNQVSIEDNVEDFYDSNVKSVTSASTRSNKARFSATVASFNVGLAHPVLGVGRGMESMYMMDAFPEFGQGDSEVQNWTKDINEKTFLGYSYPVLNQLTAIFAWFGAFGLILFLMPFFYVAREIVRNRFLLQDFRVIGLLVVFVGQFACFMSNAFFITYPLILGGLLCVLHQPMEFMGRSREAL